MINKNRSCQYNFYSFITIWHAIYDSSLSKRTIIFLLTEKTEQRLVVWCIDRVNHTHDIDHIEKLRDTLGKKSEVGHTHDVNTITNITKLSTLEDVNILSLSISKDSEEKDYTISVNDEGFLNIYYKELRIAQYIPSTGDWVFGNYSMSKIDETWENHYQVLQVIIKALKDAGILVDEEEWKNKWINTYIITCHISKSYCKFWICSNIVVFSNIFLGLTGVS